MAAPETLVTERLCIVPFSDRHLTNRYVGWLNDPEVVRYSEQRHRRHTLASCEAFVDSFRHSPSFLWAIETAQGPALHIGNIAAYVDAVNSVADVTILLGERSAWNRGFGLEAWTAVCNHLLDDVRIRKVTAGTLADNAGMRWIMRRSGMVDDGVRAAHYLLDGRPVDLVYAALFRRG